MCGHCKGCSNTAAELFEEVVADTPRGRLQALSGHPLSGYLATLDRTGELEDYSQPSLDLRLDSASIAGSAWGLSIDARARRTYRNPVEEQVLAVRRAPFR